MAPSDDLPVIRRSTRRISSTTGARESAKDTHASAEAQSLLEGIGDLNTKLTKEEETVETKRITNATT
jgi:hypothetical protein